MNSELHEKYKKFGSRQNDGYSSTQYPQYTGTQGNANVNIAKNVSEVVICLGSDGRAGDEENDNDNKSNDNTGGKCQCDTCAQGEDNEKNSINMGLGLYQVNSTCMYCTDWNQAQASYIFAVTRRSGPRRHQLSKK